MKILIIEDNEIDQEILKIKVLSAQFLNQEIHPGNLSACLSYGEAVKIIDSDEMDMIFLDLNLPDAHNYEALVNLRKKCPTVPILVITNDNRAETGRQAIHFGASDFLDKETLSEASAREMNRIISFAIERSRLQMDLISESQRANKAASAKADFLANMSHEIRTPLNLIVGTADLLAKTQISEQQKRYINTFRKASDHLLNLINNILEISQIESKGLNCRTEKVDLSKIAADVGEIIAMECRNRRIDFDFYFDPSIPSVIEADNGRIRQILLNLLNNAIKFTDHGTVTLKLIHESTRQMTTQIRFEISDTGIGIPTEELNKIFSSFYQVESGLTRKYQGTGLGLSLVKSISDFYQGTISVHSEPNKGTSVSILLNFKVLKDLKIHKIPEIDGRRITMVLKGHSEAQMLSDIFERNGAIASQCLAHQLDELEKTSNTWDFLIMDMQASDSETQSILTRLANNSMRDRLIAILPPIHRQSDEAFIEQISLTKVLYKPLTTEKILSVFSLKQLSDDVSLNTNSNQGFKILVVDDDIENREIMAEFLKPTQHDVEFCESGKEAIQTIQRKNFDIVFMDIEMPELNGYETVLKIRTLEAGQSPIILGLSANAFETNLEQARKCGFSGYITKPVRLSTILKSIQDVQGTAEFYIPTSGNEIDLS